MATRAAQFVDRSGPSVGLIVMIGLAILLNYVDRGAISIAAPLIKDEMGLSATGYGFVVSAFFWTYVPVLLVAGWLADRVSVHRLMAAGVAIWALATLATGFAGGLVSLVVLRLFMGVGEGVAFPCGSKLLARVPEARRGTANVALSGGIALGPLVGTLLGGAMLTGFGWRPMFLLFGGMTLLWLLPWSRLAGPVDRPAVAADAGAPVSYRKLLACRELWAISILHFAGTYALYFVLAWLPLYLVKVRGFSIADMALLTGLFYVVQAVAGYVVAAACDRAIIAGACPSRTRRRVGIACFLISALGVAAIAGAATTPALALWLVVTGLGAGPNSVLLFTGGQTLAGPASAGRWVGLQSAIGNLAGITGPVITGMIVDAAGYGPAFALTAGIVVAGTAVFALLVPKLAPVDWGAA